MEGVVVVAVMGYTIPDQEPAMSLPRKLKITNNDLCHSREEKSIISSLPSHKGKDSIENYTCHDLHHAIVHHLFQQINPKLLSVNCQNDINDIKNNVVVEVYDPLKSNFISLLDPSVCHSTIHSSFSNKRIIRCMVSGLEQFLGNTMHEDDPPLKIMGRFFPYDSDSGIVNYAGTRLVVKEIPNNGSDGTGLNVWDGALLLARYLEIVPEKVNSKQVLELGSGCGLVGIACFVLGAEHVVLTDLPYAIPLMKENVTETLMMTSAKDHGHNNRIKCIPWDWYHPPSSLLEYGFDDGVDVVLIADCVWMEELVRPLLNTIRWIVASSLLVKEQEPKVLISYQRRGKSTHTAFWKGLNNLFESVTEIDTDLCGLSKPDVLFLFQCEVLRK